MSIAIPVILMIIGVVGIIGYTLFQTRSTITYTAAEGEAKPSEYRAAQVSYIITLIHYWLPEFCMAQPNVYSTDDYEETYIEQTLANGLLTIRVSWSRQRFHARYALHEGNIGVCREVRCKVRLGHDAPFVKFLQAVANEELGLYRPIKECILDIASTAQLKEVAQNVAGENFNVGAELLSMMIAIGSQLLTSKKIDPINATIYLRLVAILQTQYPEVYDEFLKTNSTEND